MIVDVIDLGLTKISFSRRYDIRRESRARDIQRRG